MTEKHITISLKTPYYTFGNSESSKLKNIWLVCHGYGQLAKHFIKRFDVLNSEENYVVALQGLSKFYVDGTGGTVGATWMTKEDRLTEIDNQWEYLNSVWGNETSKLNLENLQIHFLGFSQGVTTLCRWIANQKMDFNKLILWAGGMPHELKNKLDFVSEEAKVIAVVGSEDQYFTEAIFKEEIRKMTAIFKEPQVVTFEGKHHLTRAVLAKVATL